jgi:hypothetical protein
MGVSPYGPIIWSGTGLPGESAMGKSVWWRSRCGHVIVTGRTHPHEETAGGKVAV